AFRHPRRGHARARRRADRGRLAADRGGLSLEQACIDRVAEVLAVRDGTLPSREPRQGEIRGPAGAPRGGEAWSREADRRAGNRLERGREAVRGGGSAAAGSGGRVPSGGARISRRLANGQSDFDDLVAGPEKIDCSGHGERRRRAARDLARDGNHRRGDPAPGSGDRRQDAVLQSGAQDRDAAGVAMTESVKAAIDSYDAQASLDHAWTIPAPWYVDREIQE